MKCSDPTPAERLAPDREARRRPTGKGEATETAAVSLEDLHPFATVRCIGDDETSIGSHVECAGTDDATLFRADLDDRRHLAGGGNPVDRLCPAVEDVVVAIRTLLKSCGLAKRSSDRGGEAARRLDDVDPALGSGQTEAHDSHQSNDRESGQGGIGH